MPESISSAPISPPSRRPPTRRLLSAGFDATGDPWTSAAVAGSFGLSSVPPEKSSTPGTLNGATEAQVTTHPASHGVKDAGF